MRDFSKYVFYSRTNKAFVWLPAKTGTHLAVKVLKNFGFNFHVVDERGGINLFRTKRVHHHPKPVFRNSEYYRMITTVRNPYSTFFAFYQQKLEEPTIDNFREYVERIIQGGGSWWDYEIDRIPDYPIRIENLFEDYSNLPFIKNSTYKESGKLLKDIESQPNRNPRKMDWKLFYNKSIADTIYYYTCRYFEIFGYDKDSWKIEKND